MVAKNGIKLLDFGLAQVRQKLKGGDETATITMPSDGAIEGTLQYMSPEQLQGKPADARTDIFAFGLVFYEMLTGRLRRRQCGQRDLRDHDRGSARFGRGDDGGAGGRGAHHPAMPGEGSG